MAHQDPPSGELRGTIIEALCGAALGIVAPRVVMHAYSRLMHHFSHWDVVSFFSLDAWELSVNYLFLPVLLAATGLVAVFMARGAGFGRTYHVAFVAAFVITGWELLYALFVVLSLSIKYAL
ncbi:hypothetical protein EF808_07880 [archaeon]|nr:MAG: hypothetical protein EF808_07880 [archaeon]